VAISIAAGMTMAPDALGVVRQWNNLSGGSAGTGANWTPSAIPGAGDVLNFNLSSTYSVSFPASVPASAQQNFNGGQVTLNMSRPHTVSGQFVVGLAAGSLPFVTFAGGDFTAQGIVAIGGNATGGGSLTVTSAFSIFRVVGAATPLAVGNTGAGFLNVRAGAYVRADGPVSVARLAGSQGTLTVEGSVGTVRSILETIDPVAGDITIAAAGPGTLTIRDSGHVELGSDLFVAPNAGFVGNATLAGDGSFGSSIFADGDIHVGHNTTAAAAGNATLDMADLSLVQTNSSMFVGDPNGGTGVLRLRQVTVAGSPLVEVGSLFVAGNGTLDIRSGRVSVIGGRFVHLHAPLIVNAASALFPAGMRLDEGADGFLADMTIGDSTAGFLVVKDLANAQAGTTTIARLSGSTGELVVDNGTYDFRGHAMSVGVRGNGTVLVDRSGLVEGDDLAISPLAGSVGLMRVERSAEVLLSGDLTMGGLGNVGTPTLSVSIARVALDGVLRANSNASVIELDGGVLQAAGLELNGTATLRGRGVVASPILVKSASAVIAPGVGEMEFAGPVTFGPGVTTHSILGGEVRFQPGGSYTGAGQIAARVTQHAGSFIAATGSLALGTLAAGHADLFGLVITGPHAVTLRGVEPHNVRDVSMNTGSLVSTRDIIAAGNISGVGIVSAPLLSCEDEGAAMTPNGTLTVQGAYKQATIGGAPGGTLDITVASAAGFDKLVVTGAATLGGTLRVSLAEGASLPVGSVLTIATMASRSGVFQVLDAPGFLVRYFPTRVDVEYIGCPADFNNDGVSDFFDYLDFAAAFDADDPAADFNGDDTVDFFDYLDFVAEFDVGCG
jgi:hypothetical protein